MRSPSSLSSSSQRRYGSGVVEGVKWVSHVKWVRVEQGWPLLTALVELGQAMPYNTRFALAHFECEKDNKSRR